MRMCHENYGAHCCSPEDEPVHFNDPMTYPPEFRSAQNVLTLRCVDKPTGRRFVMIVLYPQRMNNDES